MRYSVNSLYWASLRICMALISVNKMLLLSRKSAVRRHRVKRDRARAPLSSDIDLHTEIQLCLLRFEERQGAMACMLTNDGGENTLGRPVWKSARAMTSIAPAFPLLPGVQLRAC